jgi:diguanylate cyclase (GGDEF)-like protein
LRDLAGGISAAIFLRVQGQAGQAFMADATRILVSKSSSLPSESENGACLVHIYPTGPAMGSRYPISDVALVMGRDEECDIRLEDDSVSRRHACIQTQEARHFITDLQSTNGTYVNDVRVRGQKLHDGDYIHIGNCIYRYLAGGNVESQYHQEIHRLTIIDALTDVHNRRFLLESLGHHLANSCRYRRPLALILFDVDHFKEVNDRLGHLGGDFTLRELSMRVKKLVRREDVFGRYGGEEFAILMPETNREHALLCAERIRKTIDAQPFCYDSHSYAVTISAGVTAVTGEEWMTTREILLLVDENLRRAKRNGRNRVED